MLFSVCEFRENRRKEGRAYACGARSYGILKWRSDLESLFITSRSTHWWVWN